MRRIQLLVVSRRIFLNPNFTSAPRRLNFLAEESTERAIEILRAAWVEMIAYEPHRSPSGRFEFIDQIKSLGIKTPIVALTTKFDLAKEIGANGFIDPDSFFFDPSALAEPKHLLKLGRKRKKAAIPKLGYNKLVGAKSLYSWRPICGQSQ